MDIKEIYKFFDKKTGLRANVNAVLASKLLVTKSIKCN